MPSLTLDDDFYSIADTNTFLDVPLFQLNTLECVLILPGVADPADRLARLNQILAHINEKYLGTLFKDYIWCQESFRLRLAYSSATAQGHYIHGITHFGQCIEDEWLMVYILCQVSLEFPGVFVRVTDTDGDLLLIEGAEEIPLWMEPENTRNRAWINQGRLLIIPPTYKDETPLDFADALAYLQQHEKDATAFDHNPALDKLALQRVQPYPQMAAENRHRARIYVPRKVAAILHADPKIIALAAQQLDQRLPGKSDGEKSGVYNDRIKWLEHIPLSSEDAEAKRDCAPETMVLYTATFTKLIFAKYMMDPSNPPPWFAVFIPDDDKVSYEASMLGTKVTATLDLLLREHADQEDGEEVAASGEQQDEDELYERVLKDKKVQVEALPYTKNMEKEALEDELFYRYARSQSSLPAEDVNVARLVRERLAVLPSDRAMSKWSGEVDSNRWLYEMEDPAKKKKQEEEGEGEFEEVKERLGGLFGKVQEMLDKDGDEDFFDLDDDDESSSDEEGGEVKTAREAKGSAPAGATPGSQAQGDDEMKLDEDDFFEFFLKEALKLTPDQIESYRQGTFQEDEQQKAAAAAASASAARGLDLEDFEFDDAEELWTEELYDHGILNKPADAGDSLDGVPEYDALVNLMASMSSPGGMEGPAAALFAQLGASPRPEDLAGLEQLAKKSKRT